jgi:hypothetical protein
MVALEIAVMLMGTFFTVSERRSAVTTTSSTPELGGGLDAAFATVVCAWASDPIAIEKARLRSVVEAIRLFRSPLFLFLVSFESIRCPLFSKNISLKPPSIYINYIFM